MLDGDPVSLVAEVANLAPTFGDPVGARLLTRFIRPGFSRAGNVSVRASSPTGPAHRPGRLTDRASSPTDRSELGFGRRLAQAEPRV